MKKGFNVQLQQPADSIEMMDELIPDQLGNIDIKNQKMREMLLSEIDDHPQHPFKVQKDADMYSLADNIGKYGVKSPALVRRMKNGRYQLISGHRRRMACEIAGLSTMPVIVLEMSDEDAAFFLVDSNLLQRKNILYSEKAQSYKMWLETMKGQAGRPSKDKDFQVEKNYRSVDELAKITGDSPAQIYRIIDLLKLIPQFLDMMDKADMPMAVAEELIHLPIEEQKTVFVALLASDHSLDTTKAKELRQASKLKPLDHKRVELVLSGKTKTAGSLLITIKPATRAKYFDGMKKKEVDAAVDEALEMWWNAKNS